ncbi:hypothetical protein BsIDN1_14800 [Bacillus safensis]|uniref:Uncharacterized protein n=1 Tax=Bacillus safensis TaxID=561879 RepID=A0A5S9M582_BACIA|nr:hypothetical protein BsIDN1_14800 [Bacillus safensis]
MLPVFGKELGLFLAELVGQSDAFLTIWTAMRWIISPLILLIVFTALYYFAPNIRLKLKFVLPGAIFFASIGWIFGEHAVLILRRRVC